MLRSPLTASSTSSPGPADPPPPLKPLTYQFPRHSCEPIPYHPSWRSAHLFVPSLEEPIARAHAKLQASQAVRGCGSKNASLFHHPPSTAPSPNTYPISSLTLPHPFPQHLPYFITHPPPPFLPTPTLFHRPPSTALPPRLFGEESERTRLAGDPGAFENRRGGGGGGGGRGGAGGGRGAGGGGRGGGGGARGGGGGGKNVAIEKKVMLAHPWKEDKQDPTGYLMSEKLDGMRAVWDGSAMYTRSGGVIHAPSDFVSALPQAFSLDGELFLGRGNFNQVMSV